MATPRTTASERDGAVRRLVEAGASDAELAAVLGVNIRTVREDRARLGLLRRARPAPAVSDERLRDLHAAGLDNGAIASAAGLTRRTVQERLSRLRLRAHR